MTTTLLLRRTFDKPLSVPDVHERAAESDWCYRNHKVTWHGSFLSADGGTLICWFSAVDAESIRQALRQSGADMQTLWACTVHEGPEAQGANVIVERSFNEPVTFSQMQSADDAAATCLQTHRVKFLRTYFSLDRKRMVSFYRAPDAESVRLVHREAALPFDAVWAFQGIGPDASRLAAG
jgi:hypothetical protein